MLCPMNHLSPMQQDVRILLKVEPFIALPPFTDIGATHQSKRAVVIDLGAWPVTPGYVGAAVTTVTTLLAQPDTLFCIVNLHDFRSIFMIFVDDEPIVTFIVFRISPLEAVNVSFTVALIHWLMTPFPIKFLLSDILSETPLGERTWNVKLSEVVG